MLTWRTPLLAPVVQLIHPDDVARVRTAMQNALVYGDVATVGEGGEQGGGGSPHPPLLLLTSRRVPAATWIHSQVRFRIVGKDGRWRHADTSFRLHQLRQLIAITRVSEAAASAPPASTVRVASPTPAPAGAPPVPTSYGGMPTVPPGNNRSSSYNSTTSTSSASSLSSQSTYV